MDTPRDGDRYEDGSGWHEPAHLGEGADQGGTGAAGPEPAERAGEGEGWMPPAEPPGQPPHQPRHDPRPAAWGRPGRSEVTRVFAYQGDAIGAQGWALQHGWTFSDGTGPEDAVLRELLAAAPVRLSKDHRPAGVLRGRIGNLDMVAFDVLYSSGRYQVPEYAVTAAPLLTAVPTLRLSPTRFWKHRIGGLLQIPSGDEEFDQRWVLLAPEDHPQLRRLVQDPAVRGLLLGSDDGDELWTAAGHVAAVRPDGQRPELIEHHGRLLAAMVSALSVLD